DDAALGVAEDLGRRQRGVFERLEAGEELVVLAEAARQRQGPALLAVLVLDGPDVAERALAEAAEELVARDDDAGGLGRGDVAAGGEVLAGVGGRLLRRLGGFGRFGGRGPLPGAGPAQGLGALLLGRGDD